MLCDAPAKMRPFSKREVSQPLRLKPSQIEMPLDVAAIVKPSVATLLGGRSKDSIMRITRI